MTVEPLWAPFDPANVSDPYPMYRRLRNEHPVYKAQTGEFIVSRYNDVRAILKSPGFRSGNRLEWLSRGIEYFRNHDEDLSNIYRAINSFILFLNAPDHTAIRNFVSKTWDHRNVASMIESVVDERLDQLSGTFDAVRDFAQPIPAIVICRIMGIPLKDYDYIRALGVKMVRSLDLYHSWKDLVELNDTSAAFVTYFEHLISAKSDNSDEGLLSKLIAANQKEKLLTKEQLVSIAIFLFVAGEETTANSIGSAIHDFATTGNYRHLKQDAETLRTTGIEEFFRYNGPVQLLGRIARSEITIAGTTIPAESAITLIVASANRDESQFTDADRMDIKRDPNPHLAFGYGTHFCLGEWLGKLQTRTAIERFFAKFNEVEIADQKIEWQRNISVRGMKSLIVNTRQ
jgi:cytochrome P450